MKHQSHAIKTAAFLLLAAVAFPAVQQPAGAQYRLRGSGQNFYGEIGDGTANGQLVPVPVKALGNVRSVSAGDFHTVAVMTDGTVWASGLTTAGRLGNGVYDDEFSPVPVRVQGLDHVSSVDCGASFTLAVKTDGTVWGWGDNSRSQLGIYDGPNGARAIAIQLPRLTNITSVSGGRSHSMALKADGTVWAWGDNQFGQLGYDTGTTGSNVNPDQVPGLNNVAGIAAGGRFSLALKGDGTVWAWGNNEFGQLGNGTFNNAIWPVQVASLTHVIAVSAGESHGLALKDDGTVWAWGYNAFSQLGDGTLASRSAPVQVSGLNSVIAVTAGVSHSLAILRNGTVMAWGYNDYGMLADGDTVWQTKPVQCQRVTNVKQIAAGLTVSLFLAKDPDPDIDLDGNHDLIWQNIQTGDVTAWFMQGPAFYGSYGYLGQGVPTAWKIVGSADLNGDGTSDLVWQNTQTGDVSYWLMNGTQRTASDYIARNIPIEWKIVGIADINHDDNNDLIWQNSLSGDVVVWYMNGVAWNGAYDYLAHNIPTQWRIVGTADLNTDGSIDLIWQNDQTGDVVVWYMDGINWNGNYDFIAHNVPTAWKNVAVVDLDGDLYEDLIWRNMQTGDVVVWYMNGALWTGRYDTIAPAIPLEWKLTRTH